MSGSSDNASMEQVRELLLGTHLKDMEASLQRQEERLMREISDMSGSLKERMKSLENFMNSETASLMHRLQEEQNERAGALKNEQAERSEALKTEQRDRAKAIAQLAEDLAKDLAAREDALERKLTALSGTLDAAERDLRQLMLAENARLSEKIDDKYKDALGSIANVSGQLRTDLLSRSDIAGIFTEAAVRLAGQWPAGNEAAKADAAHAGGKSGSGRA